MVVLALGYSLGERLRATVAVSLRQETVPREMIGRITAIYWIGTSLFVPVGAALSTALAGRIGAPLVLAALGGLTIVIGLATLTKQVTIMTKRHFLSTVGLGATTLQRIVADAVDIAAGRWSDRRPLAGRIVGLYFAKTSTRTRTSFTAGAMRLGAQVIAYGPHDLQIETGETLQDTGRVLSQYLDVLVVRTNGDIAEMEALASQDRMSVVNAMSANEHPTQVMADLAAIQERFGRLEGIHVLHLGEGNNTVTAQMLAFAQIPGLRLTVVTPEGYGAPAAIVEQASRLARASGAVVEQHHRLDRLPTQVDVVYTSRWKTMGVPKTDPDWLTKFRPYAVTSSLLRDVARSDGRTIFLHDLPAMRGYEVTDEVLDGPASLALRLAMHKMTSAMAVLSYCAAGADRS
jgi:ornithine carbamoyltransferase